MKGLREKECVLRCLPTRIEPMWYRTSTGNWSRVLLSVDELSGWGRAQREESENTYVCSKDHCTARGGQDRSGDDRLSRFPARFLRGSASIVPTPVLDQGSIKRNRDGVFISSSYSVRILRTRRHCRTTASTSETCHNNEKLLKKKNNNKSSRLFRSGIIRGAPRGTMIF